MRLLFHGQLLCCKFNCCLPYPLLAISFRVPVLISTVLYYGQVYFIKYFFLEDRGITLSLNNV